MDKCVLIIPDVHGRQFWKGAVERFYEDIEKGAIDVVVWADFEEHLSAQDPYEGIFQVCGHSLSFPDEDSEDSFDQHYIDAHIAMLDARHAFLLNSEGVIEEV